MNKNNRGTKMEFTGERFIPEITGNIELEHIHRYLFSQEIAEGKTILDIACGEGYGSAMLAEKAEKVFGVDISPETIKYAQKRYKSDNLTFMVGDCGDIPLSDSMVNLVVSFETIEHIDHQEEFVKEVKRVMEPKGIFIVSTPDKYTYSIKPSYSNPFHKKELFKSEFIDLLQNFFKNVIILGQRIVYGSNLSSESQSTPYLSYFINDKTIETTPGIKEPIYWIALASDGSLPAINSSFFEQPINETEIIQSWRKVVTERDQSIQNLINSLQVQDHTIRNLYTQLSERDQTFQKLNTQLSERDQTVQNLSTQLSERNQTIQNLNTQLSEQDNLRVELEGRNQTIHSLLAQLAEWKQNFHNIDTQLTERDQTIQDLRLQLAEREQEVLFYALSKSWRMTRPLRKVARVFRRKKDD